MKDNIDTDQPNGHDLTNTRGLILRIEEEFGLKVDRTTINGWRYRSDNPLPVAYQGKQGQAIKYDVDAALSWVAEENARIESRRKTDADGQIIDFHEARTREMAARARKAELEAQRMAGSLVPVREIELAIEDLGRRAVEMFLSIPDRLAPKLAEETDETACSSLIDEELRRVCNRVSQMVCDLTKTDDALDEDPTA